MNWRLVGGLEAYLLTNSKEERKVYLVCPEKKQYKVAVQKMIKDSPYRTIYIEENEFSLRFGDLLEFQIKSKEFPEPDEWYTVMNGTDESKLVADILKASDYVGGEFKGSNWEVIFDGVNSDTVSFVCPKMEEYAEYFSELRRRISVETMSKTKKWIPGHRYDSIDKTIIYLGPVKSKMIDGVMVEDEKDYKTKFAYVSLLKDEKTVAEIFEKRVIGAGKYDIKFTDTEMLMVDSGEYLKAEDKMPSLYKQSPRMMEELMDRFFIKGNPKNDRSFLINIIKPLLYKTESDSIIPDEAKEKVEVLIKSIKRNIYISTWNTNSGFYPITSEQSREENIESLKRMFAQVTSNGTPSQKEIYRTWENILKDIGIDWDKLTEEVLDSWEEEDVFKSLDNYVKYSAYFDYHNPDQYHRTVNQRKKSLRRLYGNVIQPAVSLDSIYPEELCNVLKEILTKGDEEYGVGLQKYRVFNNGTKAKPLYYVEAAVSVPEIIKYYNGKVPGNIEHSIIKYKFWELVVYYDLGEKII